VCQKQNSRQRDEAMTAVFINRLEVLRIEWFELMRTVVVIDLSVRDCVHSSQCSDLFATDLLFHEQADHPGTLAQLTNIL